MVPDNKTLGFTFSLSCHSSADSGWPAELRTLWPVNCSPLEARRCNKLNDNNRTTLREHALVKLLNINQCHWTNSCLQQIFNTWLFLLISIWAVGVTEELYLGFYYFNVWNKQVSQPNLANIVITTINHTTTFNMEMCDRVVFLCVHVLM